MRYAPGSFSKNFAWHGTGLKKLHATIRHGFKSSLAPTRRQQWRANSGIGDAALELIPVNFFLHNARGRISVDELVFQAVERPHSIRFDRLGLFALHLNRVGDPPGRAVERPAMWANEFVREALWGDDAWRSGALTDESLDAFIADRMAATPDVRIKCRNNYRHLFELCEYRPTRLPIINTGAEHWIASALFLAWDRLVIDNGSQTKANLLVYVKANELHKLTGVSEAYLTTQAETLANLYLSVGALERFERPAPPGIPVEITEELGIDWVEQAESDEVVERRTVAVQAQVRDRRKSAALKSHYDNTCMICGVKLQVGEERFYSKAAHIKPLGKPHDGPDKASNMLVLCPNHHLQFDRGIIRLQKYGMNYIIKRKVNGEKLDGIKITVKHTLDDDCVRWHYHWFSSRRT